MQYLRSVAILILFITLPACRASQCADAWVYKTQGQITLGHNEKLHLCSDGRFVLEITSDVVGYIDGKRIDPNLYGVFQIKASNDENFDAIVELTPDKEFLDPKRYYLVTTERATYLLEDRYLDNVDPNKIASFGVALKKR